MSKRARITTPQGTHEVMAASLRTITPPPCVRLRERDWPFWEAVVTARARTEWNDADLIMGGALARMMADLDRLTRELDGRDDLAETIQAQKVVDGLTRRILATRRSLGLDVRGKDGRASTIATRRGHAFAIERDLGDVDDMLLASPRHTGFEQ